MNYATLDGTSMAAPHVTGAALIVAQRNPNLSPEGIRTLLMNSVDVLPQWSGLVASGGRLNLFECSGRSCPTRRRACLRRRCRCWAITPTERPYELGMRFKSDVAGQITAIRFWKTPTETGTHVGRIWTTGGTLLASVTFTGETASGWQQQALATPLAIAANTEYIVSVPTGSNGRLVATVNLLAAGLNNGPLHAPAGTQAGTGQPVGSFPASSDSTAYFRDIVFVPNSSGPDTTPPTVSITQPAQGSTVIGSITISATASDDVAVAGVQFQVDGVNLGAEVTSAPYSVVWNSTAVSNGNHGLTAIARDAAGHTTPASVTVTVNNGATPPSQGLFTTQVPVVERLRRRIDV